MFNSVFSLNQFVDYLVGDGPSNRYALICKSCHSHNGMALKEDFEYTSKMHHIYVVWVCDPRNLKFESRSLTGLQKLVDTTSQLIP